MPEFGALQSGGTGGPPPPPPGWRSWRSCRAAVSPRAAPRRPVLGAPHSLRASRRGFRFLSVPRGRPEERPGDGDALSRTPAPCALRTPRGLPRRGGRVPLALPLPRTSLICTPPSFLKLSPPNAECPPRSSLCDAHEGPGQRTPGRGPGACGPHGSFESGGQRQGRGWCRAGFACRGECRGAGPDIIAV